MLGIISNTETFGAVDGPGVRYVIFLQGCHMRCKYCHNPETWQLGVQEDGYTATAQEMLDKALRYKNYWGKNGGITVSGGEALIQMEFITELFTLAKKKGINTCIDTSGNPFSMDPEYLERFDKLMELTDLFILDIKEIEDDKHRALTGCTNENILEMATYLSDKGKAMWIRHVLVPGVTDDPAGLVKLRAFVETLKTVTKFEILPYHRLAMPKYEKLGIPYAFADIDVPTKDEIAKANEILGCFS